jgi:hypothetical protein
MSSFLSKTIDDAVLEARTIVSDTYVLAQRNPDALFIQYLNSALRVVYSLRPDAFIGNFTQGIITTAQVPTYMTADLQVIDGIPNVLPPTPATPFPIDDRQFFYPVVSYIAGRIELADDEFVDATPGQTSARSAMLLASFKGQLQGM